MPVYKSRDNTNVAEKLAIRTQVLLAANIEPLRVLETCAGEGVMWSQLRKRFKVSAYTPVDRKPRMAGTIKMDMGDRTKSAGLRTANIDAFDMANYNVIDIDPYGALWEVWLNFSHRLRHKTVFFMTHGTNMGEISRLLLRENGIPEDWPVIKSKEFSLYLGLRLLMKSVAWVNVELCLSNLSSTVRQYGIIATPKETS